MQLNQVIDVFLVIKWTQ